MTVTTLPVWSVVPLAAVVVCWAYAAATVDAALDPAPGRARLARPLVETSRLLRQPRRVTPAPDLLLWRIGIAGPFVAALLMAIVVPFGGHVVSGMAVGIVWFNAMDVVLWAFWWLAGWGPNSVYALVGGYRFLAQALAYELPLMFALTAPAVAASSLDMRDVVMAQGELWFAVEMPVAFVVFLISVVGFSSWGPLGHPAGVDVADGVLAEPSGLDRLLLLVGRYALLAVGSAMAAALFLGGAAGPWLPGWVWSIVKTLAVLVMLVGVRRRVPIVRADRLMALAWVVVLPLTLLQVLVVAVVELR
ncbi:NADH-quinone oxidoreductase subunit H [Solicola gregarius]|uniref:NADH-quinone oxidoreductase subunit H n=1 Tax=Solicola gregarius TaxID=2908642 RepID=A0AA46YKM8_9ACTN|nr:NADH-quinone oxidoreductase subunit H [Solicola gregarius]UYM05667.1 NADH-quinone oxidoreductase subunit H [Solicola gregarius]